MGVGVGAGVYGNKIARTAAIRTPDLNNTNPNPTRLGPAAHPSSYREGSDTTAELVGKRSGLEVIYSMIDHRLAENRNRSFSVRS